MSNDYLSRTACNNPYCDSKPNWFGNYALCSNCLHLAAQHFVLDKLLQKTIENIKEMSE